MTRDDFQYCYDQYYLAIVNDGAWYRELRNCLDDGVSFQMFTKKVDYMAEVIRRKHHLEDCNTHHKVYIRLMVLEYMLDKPMIKAKFGNDDIFCTHISFCHQEDMGWLVRDVLDAPATQPTTQPETTQENTMASIEIKNITFINNTDVTTLTDEQLIDAIKKLEAEIADLQAVKTNSTKIKDKIGTLQDTLAKVVAILDAR